MPYTTALPPPIPPFSSPFSVFTVRHNLLLLLQLEQAALSLSLFLLFFGSYYYFLHSSVCVRWSTLCFAFLLLLILFVCSCFSYPFCFLSFPVCTLYSLFLCTHTLKISYPYIFSLDAELFFSLAVNFILWFSCYLSFSIFFIFHFYRSHYYIMHSLRETQEHTLTHNSENRQKFSKIHTKNNKNLQLLFVER